MSLALLRWSGLSNALRSLSSLGASNSGACSQLQQQQQQLQQQQQQAPQQQQARRAYAKAPAKGGAKGKSSSKGKDAKKGPAKPKKVRSAGNFNAQDPFNARVLAMILPPGEPHKLALPEEQRAAAAARAKEYSRLRMEEHKQWQGGITQAIRLRNAALAALPEELRRAAQQPDLEPLPLARNFYYDHPPKGYRD
jgi:hypothetical protein